MSGYIKSGCPEWHYDAHPGRHAILPVAAAAVIRRLRLGGYDTVETGADSRPVHREFFQLLVDPHFPYFAGHYRGTEGFRCLETYPVSVGSDQRVGCDPQIVSAAMEALAADMRSSIAHLDMLWAASSGEVPAEDKLYNVIVVAARFFQEFLTVHPYADGNGHIARFLVWLLVGRYGFWPVKWTIEPRPATAQGYGPAISAHRDGRPELLESLIMNSLG